MIPNEADVSTNASMPPMEQLQLVRLKHDNSLPGFFKLFQASRVVLDQKMDYGLLFVLNDGLINYKIPLSLMFLPSL